jgi:glycosyltransferase involved in cell wall biosynthesis
VSVVVPTHNRPHELALAVRSVLGQTLRDLEVVVVDDGSRTPVDLNAAGLADGRVVLLRHETPQGVAQARNAAIAAARGEWVAFLDDDDLWAPDKLERQLAAAARAEASFVYSDAVMVRGDGQVLTTLIAPPPDDLTRRLFASNVIGGPSTVVVRREVLEQAGGFERRLAVVADWDMWLRLSAVAVPAAVHEVTAAVLAHPGNMQTTQVDRIREEMRLLGDRHAHLMTRPGDRLGSAWTELWIADREWKARRSASTLLTYAYWYFRCHRLRESARRARYRMRPAMAPSWVLEALRR